MYTGAVTQKCTGINIHIGTVKQKCTGINIQTGTRKSNCAGNFFPNWYTLKQVYR
jgi:hypothetical protein